METCLACQSINHIKINTYKREWIVCEDCGSGTPIQKKVYPLAFLPKKALKSGQVTEESIYDYFTQPEHFAVEQEEARNFIATYLNTNLIDVKNKKILDVSGGSGEFINFVRTYAGGETSVVLTEINKKALAYANDTLKIEALELNFNTQKLSEITSKKFDLVFLRACVMFCADLEGFAKQIHTALEVGGKVFVQYCVYPTLGTFLRVQFDEFSYVVLRNPEHIKKIFERSGFALEYEKDEVDPSLYVYDFDRKFSSLLLRYFYEIPAVFKAKNSRNPKLIARDRRRVNLIFQKK